jgi:ribonuclease BN (tRNA processing enzyme)
LHVDHSADLSSFVKGGYFTSRNANLPLYGPAANDLKPSTSNYLHNLMSDKS